MANGYQGWDSTTPDNNQTVDSPYVYWAEGQLPSTVNNSARGMMSRFAQYLLDAHGGNTVGGTANAITLTPTNALTAYATNMVYGIIPTADNTAAVTLNISGVGAKAIRKIVGNTDVPLTAGDLMRKHLHLLRYDSTANSSAGAFILMNSASSIDGGLQLQLNDDGAAVGPVLDIYRNTASPAVDDVLGGINFTAPDSAGTIKTMAYIRGGILDPTNTSTRGRLSIGGRGYNGSIFTNIEWMSFSGLSSGIGTVERFPAFGTTLYLDATGGGIIRFPGTQNPSGGSNDLDDYEEGTFNVTLAYQTVGTSTWSYASRSGTYTKIGNFVQFTMVIDATPTIGTGSGTLAITGLPFTALGLSPLSIGGMNGAWTWPASRTTVTGAFNSGGTAIVVQGLGTASSATAFAAANMTSGASHTLNISGSVIVP